MKFGSVSLILALVLTVIVVGCGKTEEPPVRKALTPPPLPDKVAIGQTASPPERGEPSPPEPKYDQNETDSKSSDNNTSIDGQGRTGMPDGGTPSVITVVPAAPAALPGPSPSGNVIGRKQRWTINGGKPITRIDRIYMNKPTSTIKAVFGEPDSKEGVYWVYTGMTVKNIGGGGTMTKVYFGIQNGIVVDIQARP